MSDFNDQFLSAELSLSINFAMNHSIINFCATVCITFVLVCVAIFVLCDGILEKLFNENIFKVSGDLTCSFPSGSLRRHVVILELLDIQSDHFDS